MAHNNLFSQLPTKIIKKRKKKKMPSFVQPMLATLTKDYFSNKEWIFETKYDGERCLAFKNKGNVTLKSRNKKIINDKYPDLVQALEQQDANNFIIDGEIVTFNQKGISDFELLQGRINLENKIEVKHAQKTTPIHYCIFDIMYVEHYDIRDLPLLARKTILKNLFLYKDLIIYSTHRSTKGLVFFKQACHKGQEGLIAKHKKSTYQGKRSPDWLKFKCANEQEFIIVGYTEPHGSRTNFGALLLGYYEDKKLQYAGKVGTGFDDQTLQKLGTKLRKLETKTCPINQYEESTKEVHWVKPKLVAQITFAEWTKGNRLRVPRYKGLRDDKSAQDVIKESPSKTRTIL